ncbi:MAG: hypothetical protein KKD31_10730 [Bacteroidetes bacterium]|nr:hypothetical protein [Bacteroidota bacterium]
MARVAVSGNKNQDWILDKPKHGGYSENDLIDAYLAGKREQRDSEKKILIERFVSNLNKAKTRGIDFFRFLVAEKQNPKIAYLKIEDISKFQIVFIIPQDVFVSEGFPVVYSKAREIKQEVNDDTFHISFSFMPFTESINEERLISDGFILRHGQL